MDDVVAKLDWAIRNPRESDTNRTIARYIREHLDEMGTLSVYDLAAACYVSQPSVSRFAKAMGYEGYRDFCDACGFYRAEMTRHRVNVHVGALAPDEKLKEARDRVAAMLPSALTVSLDDAALLGVTALADRIVAQDGCTFLGWGYSHWVALGAQHELGVLGLVSDVLREDKLETLRQVPVGTPVIMISLYGHALKNPQLRRAIHAARSDCWLLSFDETHAALCDHAVVLKTSGDRLVDRHIMQYLIDLVVGRCEQLLTMA